MTEILLYIGIFLALYFQVFVLLTIFEEDMVPALIPEPKDWPKVTVAVPCFNEEKTVGKTLESLLALDYPKDKLQIYVVDDGSTDNTAKVVEQYSQKYPSITLLKKPNGGKHTAVNQALAAAEGEFFGCLDADSYVEKDTLKIMVRTFLADDSIMAVTPTMCVHEPVTWVQQAQRFEYLLAVFIKQVMSVLGAIHVTPGPFSIFRTDVFEKIGPFKAAHKTEDMEIAFRMQSHRLKIINSPMAKVHTSTPNTIKKLFVQRTRWTYGFLRNAYDYRYMFFKARYGHIGLITLPFSFITIATTMYVLVVTIKGLITLSWNYIQRLFIFGWQAPALDGVDNFYFNLQAATIIAVSTFIFNFALLCIGQKIAEGKIKITFEVLWYYLVFTIAAPWWLGKAIIRAVRSKEVAWR